jgi:hypothetical protein
MLFMVINVSPNIRHLETKQSNNHFYKLGCFKFENFSTDLKWSSLHQARVDMHPKCLTGLAPGINLRK